MSEPSPTQRAERAASKPEPGGDDARLRLPAAPVLLAVALGAAAGVGSYTFRYAEGFSYFSTDPTACVNCHVMQPQYDAWQKASHHAVAVCVDCHLPEAFVPKYLAKAENGWRHGRMFTTQSFEEPIEVQPAGHRILETNCRRCHGRLVEQMTGLASAEGALRAHSPGQIDCLHCHADVGHGIRAGLGGPLREDEIQALERLGAPTASNARAPRKGL